MRLKSNKECQNCERSCGADTYGLIFSQDFYTYFLRRKISCNCEFLQNYINIFEMSLDFYIMFVDRLDSRRVLSNFEKKKSNGQESIRTLTNVTSNSITLSLLFNLLFVFMLLVLLCICMLSLGCVTGSIGAGWFVVVIFVVFAFVEFFVLKNNKQHRRRIR
jgi:hypothetical protein